MTRLRVARAASLVVAILAILALAALALSAHPGRAVLPDGSGGAPRVAPLVNSPAPTTAVATTVPPRRTTSPPPPSPAASTSPSTPAPSAPPRTATTTTTSAPPTAPADPVATCPLGLPPPDVTGGFASLVALVPLFGPFSAEAFAMAKAYEPVIKLFGPFLPAFETLLVALDPTLTPLVTALRQLEDAGFQQLGPLYAPYRPEVLAALGNLADSLAPYSKGLADSPASACIVAIEGVLAKAASG